MAAEAVEPAPGSAGWGGNGRARTVADLLRERALTEPTGAVYRFLERPGDEPTLLDNTELERHARAVAAALQARHAPGQRLLLLLPAGRAFLLGFFGTVLAGLVPVPVPPVNRPRTSVGLRPISQIVEDSRAAGVITTASTAVAFGHRTEGDDPLGGAQVHRIELLARGEADRWVDPEVGPLDTAFLQYTSGSTADPRGVIVTHGNLTANLATIRRAFAVGPGDHAVVWLPPHHDMGLVGGLLVPLASGFDVTCFPANDFVQSPVRWLRTITETGCTVSGGPDFAYRLCVERVRDDQVRDLDLRSWRLAFTGAEPVSAATMRDFAARFGPCGFDPAAFYPCYGLAEATLMVTGGTASDGPLVRSFSRRGLDDRGLAQSTEDRDDGRDLVSCGPPADARSQVVIVDPTSGAVHPPEHLGEIWVDGPSVAAGYTGRPEDTEAAFGATTSEGHGPYLRTGDLGFLSGGELYVTGRLKDTIVVNGRTLHAPDVESTVRSALSVPRTGLTAALSIVDGGPERLVVVQELGRDSAPLAARLTRDIQAAIAGRFGVRAHDVVLARVGSIPRTTSGKVRRLEARARYISGGLRLLVAPAIPVAGEIVDAGPAGEPSLPGQFLDVDGSHPDHETARADAEPGAGDAGRADA